MPIEFPCDQCQQILRTPDGTAGKRARCPACGQVQTVPAKSTFEQPKLGATGQDPYAGLVPPPTGIDVDSPFSQSDNPYQSPLAGPGMLEMSQLGETAPRTGPPWEKDGASIKSLLETLKLIFASTTFFFADMRREGGLGRPLAFGVAVGMIGFLALMSYQVGMQAVVLFLGVGNRGDGAQMQVAIGLALGLALSIGLAPLGIILYIFILSGIQHLVLLALGGARFGFETTFRVISYSSGGAALFLFVPCCGQYILAIGLIVLVSIGLSLAHEISGLKATAAVLLPMLLCCGSFIGLFVWALSNVMRWGG